MKDCSLVAGGICIAAAVALALGACFSCHRPPAPACDTPTPTETVTPPPPPPQDQDPRQDPVPPPVDQPSPIQQTPVDAATRAPSRDAAPPPACVPCGKPFRATVVITPEC